MADGSESQSNETDSRARRLERASERRAVDVAALGHAHSDAQVVLERTLETFTNLSNKAFRLVQLNGLVLTILVAASSQVSVGRYANVPAVGGVLSFVVSALFAVMAYRIRTVDTGIDTGAFRKLTDYKLREREYLDWVLTRGYPRWIADAVHKTNRKERWIHYSLVTFVGGIGLLFAGMLFTMH